MYKYKTNLKIVSGNIDLAALIDVVFLLLIFFLLSSSLVFQPGIPVDLPEIQNKSMRAADKLVITLTKDNYIFFNDKQLSWNNLEKELREEIRKITNRNTKCFAKKTSATTSSVTVILSADKNVRYEQIVKVMDLARSLNVGVYLIAKSE
ncbi:MAG: biopolymer transporter ExbD [Verrucomicrobiota bacterium]|nr:biopolymer transporter ExbD [Verrucomicrobiota bacterium]